MRLVGFDLYPPYIPSFLILTQPAASASEAPTEVSWQVAWWSLVPLALAAMTQPCGKVLDNDEKDFRFWARSSPLVCIIDLLRFVVLLILDFAKNPPSRWIESAKSKIRHRFDSPAAINDIESAENTIWIRWALLILGGVPCQTIKLVAMSGIPWTKTWALMYFISIVFGEILIFVAARVGRGPISVRTFGAFPPPDIPQLAPIHFQYAAWLAVALVLIVEDFYNWGSGSEARLPDYHLYKALAIPVVLYAWILQPMYRDEGRRNPWRLRAAMMIWVSGLAEGVVALVRFLRIPSFSAIEPWFINSASAYFSILLLYCPMLLGFARANQKFRSGMAPFNAILGPRLEASMCVVTLFLSLMYYAFAFDSTGTVNPDWTGVFG
jgi:hypothetical protein